MVAWLRILGARPHCAWTRQTGSSRATDASPGSVYVTGAMPGWMSSGGGFGEIRLPV
jgi:hypothetical protein